MGNDAWDGLGNIVSNDLVIHFDYQKLLRQLKLFRKAKEILNAPNYWTYQDVGAVRLDYKHTPLDGGLESVYFYLDGDGPFYLLDTRMLKIASKIVKPFKFEGIGSIVHLKGLQLKVVAEYRNDLEYLVMLPSTWAIIFYYLFPISKWFDKIYRRLILTAVVWGLADCSPAEMPYWGHLKWFQDKTKNGN